MPDRDPLAAIYEVATDDEAGLLDALLARAHLIWTCRCGWYTPVTSAKCQNCGARAPESRPRPAPHRAVPRRYDRH